MRVNPWLLAAFVTSIVLVPVVAPALGPVPGTGNVCAVPLACAQWEELYNGPGSNIDRYKGVAVSPDGTVVYAAGESDTGTAPESDGIVVALDAGTGAEIWRVRATVQAIYQDVAVSPDGSTVFATGTASSNYYTTAMDASDGSQLWNMSFDHSARADAAHHVAVTPDGSRVIVSGSSFNTTGTDSWDYLAVAYDAVTGGQLWFRGFNYNQNSDEETALALSPDGARVYMTGRSYNNSNTGYEIGTVAIGTVSGEFLWKSRFNSETGNHIDYGVDIVATPDGSAVLVAGQSYKSGVGYNITVVALSPSSGSKIWDVRWDGAGNSKDEPMAMAVAPDSSAVYVTGFSYQMDSGSDSVADMVTLAYRVGDGAKLWEVIYDGPGGLHDRGMAVTTSPLGSVVFVTGHSYGLTTGTPTFQDIVTHGYSAATGADLWTHRIEHETLDAPTDIAVSGDGRRLFVAGLGTTDAGPNNFDALVAGYDLVNVLGA